MLFFQCIHIFVIYNTRLRPTTVSRRTVVVVRFSGNFRPESGTRETSWRRPSLRAQNAVNNKFLYSVYSRA